MGQSTAALCKALGPHCSPIGLATLGTAAVQRAWSDAEEALLEEGMRAWGRDFRQARLPCRPPPVHHNVLPVRVRGGCQAEPNFVAVRTFARWSQLLRRQQESPLAFSTIQKGSVVAHKLRCLR